MADPKNCRTYTLILGAGGAGRHVALAAEVARILAEGAGVGIETVSMELSDHEIQERQRVLVIDNAAEDERITKMIERKIADPFIDFRPEAPRQPRVKDWEQRQRKRRRR